MASSLDVVAARLTLAFGLGLTAVTSGCAVGDGEGDVTGVITALDCDRDEELYELDPSFFGAQAFEDILNIRIQRGSDFQDRSDGISLQVGQASLVQKELLDTPIPIEDSATALVQMTLYLNRSCPTDFTGLDRPVVMAARAGRITFSAIYAPEESGGDREIAAAFEDVELHDPSDPEGRNARLSGVFRFVFNRGRPAQRYP